MPSKKLNFEEARNIRLSRALEQQKKEDEEMVKITEYIYVLVFTKMRKCNLKSNQS